jgi:cardiolipin synthase
MFAPEIARSQAEGTVTAPLGTSENPSNAIFTIANVITMLRFVLTMVFLVLFVRHEEQTRVLALACYAIAACTDFLDGQVARRTQTVSWVGKIMDPLMDRVLLFTGVLGLMAVGELPVWVAAFVVCRDVYLGICAAILQRYRKRPLDVIFVGKVATALLMTGFVDLLIGAPVVPGLGLVSVDWLPGLNSTPSAVGIFFVYLGLVCSLAAAIIYTVKGARVRRDVLAKRSGEASR